LKVKIFKGIWKLEQIKEDSDKLYVFGDNDARIGKGGQAIIRDLPNSIGLRTKKGPSKKPVAFYSDDNLDLNKIKIQEDILNIKFRSLLENKTIVLSDGGYGTGLANLKERAPKTFEYLNELLKLYFGFINESGTHYTKISGHDEIIMGKRIELEKDSITPINNTFFNKKYLEKGLYTHFDMIKSGSKVAFTSTKKHKINDILIIKGPEKDLVCRVVDCYSVKILKDNMWWVFEGYSEDFKVDFKIDLYQTQIDYICTLDKNGNMIFKDDLFGETKTVKKKENQKILGDPIKVDKVKKDIKIEKNKPYKKYDFEKMLNNLGIDKYDSYFISDKKSDLFGCWEIKFNNVFYYFNFKKGILSNNLNLIYISNNSLL
jgi:hypothetical protein